MWGIDGVLMGLFLFSSFAFHVSRSPCDGLIDMGICGKNHNGTARLMLKGRRNEDVEV